MKSLWVKNVGEKYVQKGFLGEESVGEKYMGEKYVQKGFLGEESVGEKYVGQKYVQKGFLGEEPNARFFAPTCLVSSLWFSCGVAVSMGEAGKHVLFECFQAGCHGVLHGRRGTL